MVRKNPFPASLLGLFFPPISSTTGLWVQALSSKFAPVSCTRQVSGRKTALRRLPITRGAALPLFPPGKFGADFVRNVDAERRHNFFYATLALGTPDSLISTQDQFFKDIATFHTSIFIERHCFSPPYIISASFQQAGVPLCEHEITRTCR